MNRPNKHGSQSASINYPPLKDDRHLASDFILCMHQSKLPRAFEADTYAGARSDA
jgi:hypothetical protein